MVIFPIHPGRVYHMQRPFEIVRRTTWNLRNALTPGRMRQDALRSWIKSSTKTSKRQDPERRKKTKAKLNHVQEPAGTATEMTTTISQNNLMPLQIKFQRNLVIHTGGRESPRPMPSPGALDFMSISPPCVIRENHIRQTIIKNSRRDSHKMK
jgi:hypothetical protein